MRGCWVLFAALLLPVAGQAQEVRGQGSRSSELFSLDAGLVVFEVEHTGEGGFRVRLLDEGGAPVDQLAEGVGVYRDAREVRIARSGRYRYEVSATGAWSVRLRSAPTPGRASGAGGALDPARIAGMEAARDVEAVRWMATGLLGGLVLGPVGAGVNFAIAGGRDTVVPEQELAAARARGPDVAAAFEQGYRSRVRTNRRTGALIGGATGSLVFGFVILQIVNWSGGTGGQPDGGGGGGGGTAALSPVR